MRRICHWHDVLIRCPIFRQNFLFVADLPFSRISAKIFCFWQIYVILVFLFRFFSVTALSYSRFPANIFCLWQIYVIRVFLTRFFSVAALSYSRFPVKAFRLWQLRLILNVLWWQPVSACFVLFFNCCQDLLAVCGKFVSFWIFCQDLSRFHYVLVNTSDLW